MISLSHTPTLFTLQSLQSGNDCGFGPLVAAAGNTPAPEVLERVTIKQHHFLCVQTPSAGMWRWFVLVCFFSHHFQFWLFIGQRPSGVPPKSHDAWQTSSREAPRIAAESGGPRETLVLICAALLSSPRWRRRSITATICRSTRLSPHGGTKRPDQRSTAGEDAPPPLGGVDAPPPRTPDRCFGRRR